MNAARNCKLLNCTLASAAFCDFVRFSLFARHATNPVCVYVARPSASVHQRYRQQLAGWFVQEPQRRSLRRRLGRWQSPLHVATASALGVSTFCQWASSPHFLFGRAVCVDVVQLRPF